MIRLLRKVLRVGLLAGVGVGILKVVKGRTAPDPWADSWVSTGTPGATRPSPAPVPAATPKPPAPAGTASATVGVPPAASPKPPAPDATAQVDLASPPAATPAPPPPDTATSAEESKAEGETPEEESGNPAPKSATRAAKPSRTGPARKSPTGKAEEPPSERLWVTANDGVCPQSHPVKAKLASKIFHTPGARNYSRTKADRCYADEASAQADGLRPALR